jgi:hypothetical protein
MTVEKMGIPTAPIVTIAFEQLAKTNAASRGMPHERICFTPHPMTDKTDAEMYQVLLGNDPVTGKPFMKEVIDALTVPLTPAEEATGETRPNTGPATYSDTPENLQRFFANNNMTDFIPIILPTEEKVEAMLKGTSHNPDEIVGTMSAAHGAFPEWTYNVRQVAINAVMAGAQPEFFPAILAIASTGQPALFSSTSSFARMAVVNGPYRDKIKMNYGIGAMGPFNDANATIGRAWTILSKNLGAAGMPGQTYMGSQGTNLNYNNVCFAETEDKLPDGWKPLHVQHGFKPEDSTVTIFTGWSLSNICFFGTIPYHEIIANWLTHFFSTSNFSATLILDPTVAADIKRHGFDSQDALREYLVKNTKTPAWLYWQRREKEKQQGLAGVEPYASYVKLGDDADIPESRFVPRRFPGMPANGPLPNTIEIIVMGGETNTYYFGGDFRYTLTTSIDKWV